jgi:hypothetical protein
VKARLADWTQCETALEAGQAMVKEQAERQPPAFTEASQNLAVSATLLDALLAPQGVPTAEKHPQHRRYAAGREFPAASGRGLYSPASPKD